MCVKFGVMGCFVEGYWRFVLVLVVIVLFIMGFFYYILVVFVIYLWLNVNIIIGFVNVVFLIILCIMVLYLYVLVVVCDFGYILLFYLFDLEEEVVVYEVKCKVFLVLFFIKLDI